MIPVHDFSLHNAKAVKVNRLNELTNYDFGEPHRHSYFEFFVFIKGGGIHQIDFDEYKIESGSIHIVAPGQIHLVKRDLDSSGFVVLFETDVFETNSLVTQFLYDHICFENDECSPIYHFNSDVQSEIGRTVENLWIDFNSDNRLKNEFVLSSLTTLFIQCIRAKQNPSVTSKVADDSIYSKFRRLLKNNFKTIKKVKEYTSTLNITEKNLNEIVFQKTGKTTSAVIYDQIVLEAKRLLRTGISAKETSFELGFEDPAHFSKFFKTQSGYTPAEFQKVQG